MAGEVWRLLSSRVMMIARLKWVHQRQQKSDASFVTIVCVYAPTAKAPPTVRSRTVAGHTAQGDTL